MVKTVVKTIGMREVLTQAQGGQTEEPPLSTMFMLLLMFSQHSRAAEVVWAYGDFISFSRFLYDIQIAQEEDGFTNTQRQERRPVTTAIPRGLSSADCGREYPSWLWYLSVGSLMGEGRPTFTGDDLEEGL